MTRFTKPSDTAEPGTQLPSNGKTILIAEDDPFISRMYEVKLKNAGYNVVVKNNGRDAYNQIKESRPDLMLLDISMPELTGFEILSALANDGYDFSRSPAMILTNSSSAEHIQLAKSFGVDYLIKAELTPRDVLSRINGKLNLAIPEAGTS